MDTTHVRVCANVRGTAHVCAGTWKSFLWYVFFVLVLTRKCKHRLIFIYVYKVPFREVARRVAQERNEKHPARSEYHYAGNSRIRIVLILTLIHNTNDPCLSGQGGTFFCLLGMHGPFGRQTQRS